MTKPKFQSFLELGRLVLSKEHSVYYREEWASKASENMRRNHGCMASACCLFEINGIIQMMLFMAHTRNNGYVRWSIAGDKEVAPSSNYILTPTDAANEKGDSWYRDVDAEFLLLNYIANKWLPTQIDSGYIALYVELPPCSSCLLVIDQFRNLYPHLKLDVQCSARTTKPT